MATYQAETVTMSIDRDWRQVYDFVSIPQNFSRWAAGLGTRFEKSGDEWIAEDGNGQQMRIRFAPPNELGALDHVVLPAAGGEINCPMRVVANGTGAEVTFTVFRLPPMTETEFSADAAAVKRDLETLKALLER
jgi:hypothetical protein